MPTCLVPNSKDVSEEDEEQGEHSDVTEISMGSVVLRDGERSWVVSSWGEWLWGE